MTDDEIKKTMFNYKAMKILHCALLPDQFAKVASLKSAKDIWDTLTVTYEGSAEIKKTKIELLLTHWELFKKEEKESISEMHTRFTKLTNEMTSLGKEISN